MRFSRDASQGETAFFHKVKRISGTEIFAAKLIDTFIIHSSPSIDDRICMASTFLELSVDEKEKERSTIEANLKIALLNSFTVSKP